MPPTTIEAIRPDPGSAAPVGRRLLFILAAVFVLALIVRVGATSAFVGLASPPRESANPDQLDYEIMAYHLSTGDGFTIQPGVPTASRAPGTSFVLLPVYLVGGHSYALGRSWLAFLSALTCVLTALIAYEVFGALPAALAGTALALYPGHFYQAMHFVSEGPYCFFLALAMLCTVLAWRRDRLRWSIAAGVAGAMAVLIRPQAMFILLAAGPMLFLAPRGLRSRWARHLLVQGCVVAALLAPWVARNTMVMGKPTLTTVGGPTFWGANNELVMADPALQGTWIKNSILRKQLHPLPSGEVAAEAAAWRYGLTFLQENTSRLPRLLAMKLFRLISPFPNTENRGVYWSVGLSWVFTGPLVLLGAVLAWRKNRATAAILFLPIVGLIICTLVFYGDWRFRDSIAPILVLLAVLPVAAAIERLAKRRNLGCHALVRVSMSAMTGDPRHAHADESMAPLVMKQSLSRLGGWPAVLLGVTVLAVFALALHLRSASMTTVVSWDEADYAMAAREGLLTNALDLGGINAGARHYHAPLSIYAIWASTSILGLHEFALRLPGVLISAAACALAVLVGYDLCRGSRLARLLVGMVAGLFWATAPASIDMVRTAKPHAFVEFFLLLNIWTLCRYLRRPSTINIALFSLSLAGQFLAMEYGLIVVGLSFVAIALIHPAQLGLPRIPWMARSAEGSPTVPVRRHIAIAAVTCMAAIAFIWPAGIFRLHALMNWAYYVRYAAGGHPILFRGLSYTHVPKYAYAWWYAHDYPVLLATTGLGALLIGVWAWKDRRPVPVTLAVFGIGLAIAVHLSHIMDLSYSLFMIPPLVLGAPLAGAWLAQQVARRSNANIATPHGSGLRTRWALAATLGVAAAAAILGGEIRPVADQDRSNELIVGVARRLAHVAGDGDRVLAQAWPVVRYVLVQEGRADVQVCRYDPRNYESDHLSQRAGRHEFDWAVTAGATAGAHTDCPMLAQLHAHWPIAYQAGAPPREYRLYRAPEITAAMGMR